MQSYDTLQVQLQNILSFMKLKITSHAPGLLKIVSMSHQTSLEITQAHLQGKATL